MRQLQWARHRSGDCPQAVENLMNIERAASGRLFFVGLVDQAPAEADCYRVSAAAGLELREEVADMALDRLLREEEPDADLAVHEAVRDQLQHLDLARGRLLLELLQRRRERDDLGHNGVAPGGDGLEPGHVLPVAGQDVVALSGVHEWAIGPLTRGL